MKHILDVAYEVLKEANEPLHVNNIALIAVQKGETLGLSFEAFVKKLNSSLIGDLKREKPRFAKIQNKNGSFKKGIYRHRNLRAQQFTANTIAPSVSNLFLGKAGEYLVMSELLFWGFNVSLMTVDEGVDIIASKENKYFHLQVKTASDDGTGKFKFTIKKQSFINNSGSNVFYIFVMRFKSYSEFIVMPANSLIEKNTLGIVNGEANLNVTFAMNKSTKHYMLNSRSDVQIYLHNFSQIK